MNRIFAKCLAASVLGIIYIGVLQAGENRIEPKLVIWFCNDHGGGSSHLNIENKYKDEGKTESFVDHKLVYSVNYKNTASFIDAKSVEVVSIVEIVRNGKVSRKTVRQKITKDGELKVPIFKGIHMKFITTGLSSGVVSINVAGPWV